MEVETLNFTSDHSEGLVETKALTTVAKKDTVEGLVETNALTTVAKKDTVVCDTSSCALWLL
jgi:hypothetical protein